jgi:hypothetical protein
MRLLLFLCYRSFGQETDSEIGYLATLSASRYRRFYFAWYNCSNLDSVIINFSCDLWISNKQIHQSKSHLQSLIHVTILLLIPRPYPRMYGQLTVTWHTFCNEYVIIPFPFLKEFSSLSYVSYSKNKCLKYIRNSCLWNIVGLYPKLWGIKNVPTCFIEVKVKVKISLLQAVEAPRVARGQGSHIT